MLSATSHIGLEFLTKFLNMSKLQNRLILLYQSLPLQIALKTLKIGKFWVFCLFRFQFDIFFIEKTAIISSGKPTGQQIPAMLSVFNILIHEVYRKRDKSCKKNVKNRKSFVIFGVFFLLKNRIHIFIEYYWTTNSCLVERFQHSDPRCLSKKAQKLHKNVENWEIFEFLLFSGSFWVIMESFSSFPKISKNLLQIHIARS